jgi:predicted transcriptional regulator
MSESDEAKVDEHRLAALRAEIALGLEQARQGNLIPGDEVFARLRAKSAERRQSTSNALGEGQAQGS